MNDDLPILMLDHRVLSRLEASHPVAARFPFVDYWWLYIGLTLALLILLVLDSKRQTPARREAILWIGIAGMLGLVLISRF